MCLLPLDCLRAGPLKLRVNQVDAGSDARFVGATLTYRAFRIGPERRFARCNVPKAPLLRAMRGLPFFSGPADMRIHAPAFGGALIPHEEGDLIDAIMSSGAWIGIELRLSARVGLDRVSA